jgi:hypothetical protein
MPTSEDFQRAFVLLQADTSTPKVANGFAMLKANYRSPGKTISAARLAQAAGYQSFSTANEQYGSFAHKVADILSYEPDRRWTAKPVGRTHCVQLAPRQIRTATFNGLCVQRSRMPSKA